MLAFAEAEGGRLPVLSPVDGKPFVIYLCNLSSSSFMLLCRPSFYFQPRQALLMLLLVTLIEQCNLQGTAREP